MNSCVPMDQFFWMIPLPLRWLLAFSTPGGYCGSTSLCRTLYIPRSAEISHQQLAMSYSPHALGFLDRTVSGALNPLDPVLFWSWYFAANPGLDVPTRAAYSHSASVGSRTFRPFFSETMSQNFL